MMSIKKGIISKIQREIYYITSHEGVYLSKARGNFRNKAISPLVGDRVEISVENGLGYITKIYPRSVKLHRPEVANIDKAIIIMSIRQPDINLLLLDKYLLMIEKYGLESVLVFNKADLIDDKTKKFYADIYGGIGYKIMFNSNYDDNHKNILLDEFKGNISCVIGPSGAGKSSTLKKLFPKEDFVAGEISSKTKRGKQTTRHIEMKEVMKDSFVLDTPGFSSFDLSFIDNKDEIKDLFVEFKNNKSKCRFNNCQHINEPGCQIKKLLEEKEIARTRYDNYIRIIDEYDKIRRY